MRCERVARLAGRERLHRVRLVALDALEHMKVLSPGQAAFWREAGVMQMRLGRLKHAVESFEGFMARAPDGPDRRKIASVIQELRERLH